MSIYYNIIIAEFYPEYNDGRVKRIQSLEAYLREDKKNYKIFSNGRNTKKINHIKYGVSLKRRSMNRSEPSNKTQNLNFINKKILHFIKSIMIIDYQFINLFFLILSINNNYEKDRKNILIFSVPWFSILLALPFIRVQSVHKVIIDFRDLPFARRSICPNKISLYILKKLLKYYVKKENFEVWVTTENAKVTFKQFIPEVSKILCVPNGVESSMFNRNQRCDSDGCAYFGNIGAERSIEGVYKQVKDKFGVFHLYGNLDSRTKSLVGSDYKGFLQSEELLQTALRYKYLFLTIHENEDARNAIPGKVYEYLAIGKPIVLDCPGDAAVLKLLRDLNYPFFDLRSGVSQLDLEVRPIQEIKSQFLRRNIWRQTIT